MFNDIGKGVILYYNCLEIKHEKTLVLDLDETLIHSFRNKEKAEFIIEGVDEKTNVLFF